MEKRFLYGLAALLLAGAGAAQAKLGRTQGYGGSQPPAGVKRPAVCPAPKVEFARPADLALEEQQEMERQVQLVRDAIDDAEAAIRRLEKGNFGIAFDQGKRKELYSMVSNYIQDLNEARRTFSDLVKQGRFDESELRRELDQFVSQAKNEIKDLLESDPPYCPAPVVDLQSDLEGQYEGLRNYYAFVQDEIGLKVQEAGEGNRLLALKRAINDLEATVYPEWGYSVEGGLSSGDVEDVLNLINSTWNELQSLYEQYGPASGPYEPGKPGSLPGRRDPSPLY